MEQSAPSYPGRLQEGAAEESGADDREEGAE